MKRLSYLLTLLMLFPTFAQAGSKKHHEIKQATQEINSFLNNSYSNDAASFERDKRNAQSKLSVLPQTLRSLYQQRIQGKQQPVLAPAQPVKTVQEKRDRAERNRINAERNRKQAVPTVAKTAPPKNNKQESPKSFKEFAASWIKKQFFKHPLITLAVLGGGTYGFYKLYQMIMARAHNNNQPVPQQAQCLRCQQQKSAQEIITIPGCNHRFCASCLAPHLRNENKQCPALGCQVHLCGNQCRRKADATQPCDSHIEPLTAQINAIVKKQRTLLHNNNLSNAQNNNQQPSLTQMVLQAPLQALSQGVVGGVINMITNLWS